MVQVSNQLGLTSSICWIWHDQSSEVSWCLNISQHPETAADPIGASTMPHGDEVLVWWRHQQALAESAAPFSGVNRKTVCSKWCGPDQFSIELHLHCRVNDLLQKDSPLTVSGWLWPKSTSVCCCFSNCSRHTQPSRKQLNFECVRSDGISHVEKFAVQSAPRFGLLFLSLFFSAFYTLHWKAGKATKQQLFFVKCLLYCIAEAVYTRAKHSSLRSLHLIFGASQRLSP